MADSEKSSKAMSRDEFKVCIVGDCGSGKSSYCTNFCFNHVDVVDPNHEDMYARTHTLDDRMYHAELYECCGIDEFQRDAWYRSADAFVILFDVTQKDTFDSIEGYRNGIIKALEDITGADPHGEKGGGDDEDDKDKDKDKEKDRVVKQLPPTILFGNKTDLPPGDREVSISEGKHLSQALGKRVGYWEGAVVNRKNVDEPLHELIRFVRKIRARKERKNGGELEVDEDVKKGCCVVL